jgi:phosphoglycerate dehydrogenase-like enzyme
MERPKLVVLCGDDRPPNFSEIESRVQVRYVTDDDLAQELPDADALFVWNFRSGAVRSAWPTSGGPRWAHISSVGVNTLLFPGVVDGDVVLTNSRGVFERPLAEYVLALMLTFAKQLHVTLSQQKQHVWQRRDTSRLAGTKAVVVGSGPIGREIARLLDAVGVDTSVVGRAGSTRDPSAGTVHTPADLPHLLPASDWVIAIAPLTAETEGMFDASFFARMRPDARFINVGRGALVVEPDLIAALRGGTIGGAGLDVFREEPLSADSPLWDLPNVLVSPHMSADVRGRPEELVAVFVENLDRWLAQEPLRNVVDKRRGYVPG